MSVTIGKAIKIIREAKGESLGSLAIKAKVSIPYLSLVESDKRTPSFNVVAKVASALEVPADVFYLIGSGVNSSLNTTSDIAMRLMSMMNQMKDFEEKIKDEVKKQGH